MAKGNPGNLLHHYVGLEAAHRLAARVDAFDFIDLFAMAPWEPLAATTAGFQRTLAACDMRHPECSSFDPPRDDGLPSPADESAA